MAIKLNLSAKDILETSFPGAPRGYDALKVDEFLDEIIKDYLLIEQNALIEEKELEKLENKINELENKNRDLEIEVEKYKSKISDIQNNKNVTVDNIDLIKRIRSLEKFIWNHGTNPNTIK